MRIKILNMKKGITTCAEKLIIRIGKKKGQYCISNILFSHRLHLASHSYALLEYNY